jgi:type II secretory pathway pseudopilin PulG
MLDQHLRQSKSLFEQVAILIQQQLIHYFPNIIHATSVEIWCHTRSQDEGHRLHYDMDEILLWLARCRKQEQQQQQQQQQQQTQQQQHQPQQEQSRKRPKIHPPPPTVNNEVAGQITTTTTTPVSGESPSSSLLLVKSNQLVKNDDDDTENDDTDCISCPIVSCVLTLSVPNSTKCLTCGEVSNCAPTIVCNQSIILKRRTRQSSCCATTTMSSNVGYLCFPKVNRLLAFEGSLLHGVIPGIPTLQSQSSVLSSMSSDDDDDDSYDDKDDKKIYHDNQRITMILGFWKNVCTTKSTIIGNTVTTSSSPFGPNVPYANQKGSWKEDFKPISISKDDLDDIMKLCNAMSNKSISDLVVIDPLWIPIHSTIEEEEGKKMSDNTFGECSFCNGSSSSRFFLQSNSPCEIDNEVLCGI